MLLLMLLILTCLNVFNGLNKEQYCLIKILMPRVRIFSHDLQIS